MGIAALWERWFGPAAEINYGAPLSTAPLIPAPMRNITNTSLTAPMRIVIEGEEDIILSPGSSASFPADWVYSLSQLPVPARLRASRSVNAHGTASRKPNRRSTKKKPTSRKRSR